MSALIAVGDPVDAVGEAVNSVGDSVGHKSKVLSTGRLHDPPQQHTPLPHAASIPKLTPALHGVPAHESLHRQNNPILSPISLQH